jgi:hypothetical protein
MSDRRAIWKFPVDLMGDSIEVPADCSIVEFALQDGQLCVWAIVDPASPRITRRLRVVGTGREFEDGWRYHGTAHMPNGLVWHLLSEAM